MKNLTDLRASGLLLAISSLPSKHGIGTLGEEAFHFIDFLHASGQTFWQMLPIGPTGYGDSPYQSSSSYAGNPYFIDLDLLCADGLLSVQEVEETPFCTDPSFVDYSLLYKHRRPLLRKAFLRALERGDETDLLAFMRKEESWLPDFAGDQKAKRRKTVDQMARAFEKPRQRSHPAGERTTQGRDPL